MRLDSGRILGVAGSLLALGTVFGAFGSHALRGKLPPDRLDFYITAVRYQYLHSLGLVGVGLAARSMDCAILRWAAGLLLVGIVLFCGSLYGMTFEAPRALGALTAAGGLMLVVGWALFAWSTWRTRQP